MNQTDTPKKSLKLYILSALFGIIGAILTIATVYILDETIKLIWEHGFGMEIDDPSRTIASLIVVVVFGLAIGLISKYFGPAKGSIETVIEEALEKGGIDWKRGAKDVIIGIISIGSGGSLGPEAPAAIVTAGAASLASEKTVKDLDTKRAMSLSAVAGMLGSLLSSPFLATTMFIESYKKRLSEMRSIVSYSLVAGAFGMATFFVLFNTLYVFDFGIPSYAGPTEIDLVKAFLFGLAGALFAVTIGVIMKILDKIFKKFDKKLVIRSLIGATIAGLIAFVLPMTMFSGQHTLPAVIGQAATASIVSLLVLAFGKMIATTILIRTGFFGGPIFPAVFAGAALGIAVNGLLDAPLAVAISSTIAGIITVSLRHPLSAAILTLAIAGTTNAAPVVLAVAAAVLVISMIEIKQKVTATK